MPEYLATARRPWLVLLAFALGSGLIPPSAHAACLPTKETLPALKYQLPNDCTDAEKEQHAIAATEIVDAIKAGKAVLIENAVVRGPITLRSTTVEREISITRTRITDPVDWSYATFKQPVSLRRTTFEKHVTLIGATVEKDMFLTEGTFKDVANFIDLKVMGVCYGDAVKFQKMATFNRAVFEKTAFFRRHATFEGEADFGSARIGSNGEFTEAVFKQKANFNSVRIERHAIFKTATFEGEADFIGARIGSTGEFSEAVFKRKASFNSVRIDASGFFKAATFGGETDFIGARIGSTGEFTGAVFKQKVDFGRAWIEESAFFNPATFGGAAQFGHARIGSTAEFAGSVFKQKASFNSARIERGAFFNPATFEGEADFISARIGGSAEFAGSVFKRKANFNSARIEESAFFSVRIEESPFFKAATFEGEADFIGARIGSTAEFTGCVFKQKASFNRAEIGASAFFRPATFEGEADFISARIGGNAEFTQAVFKKRLTLYSANVAANIFFTSTTLGDSVDLRGATYTRIHVSWDDLRDRLRAADAKVYAQLENTFRQSGESALASEVYYHGRYAEGDRIQFTQERFRWVNDRRLRYLVDYGRKPFRLLWLSLACVVVGLVIFRTEGAVAAKDRDRCPLHPGSPCTPDTRHRLPWATALWVSLNAFIPGAEVTAASPWEPSPSNFFIQKRLFRITYAGCATLLRLGGWIILVLGVAALPDFLLR